MRLKRKRGTPAEATAESTAEMLRRTVRHPNYAHLNAQIIEIVEERSYLQHGVEVVPGDVVLDAGANVGVAAIFFAVECQAGVVHSFEPIEPIFAALTENLRPFPNCIPHHYGLSDASRSDTIVYYPDLWALSGSYADPDADRPRLARALRNLGASEEQATEGTKELFTATELPCELRTVSDVLRDEGIDRVDLLKLDVEMAELDVLKGIEDEDWPAIRQVAGELHLEEDGRGRFAAMLRERGFDVAVTQEPSMEGTPVHLFYAVRG